MCCDGIYSLLPKQLPRRVDIEPTIKCNFGCTFCQRTYWTRTAPDMNLAQFKHIYDSFPLLDKVKIQGIGEPTLNRDLFEMISYAKGNGSWVLTYTNGSTLHLNSIAERLLDSQPDLVRISLDGGTKETFEFLRPRSNFETIIRNASHLVGARGGKTFPTIEFWGVCMSANIRELSLMVELASHSCVDALRVQMIMNTFEYKQEVGSRLASLSISEDIEIAKEHIELAKVRANELGVKLHLEHTKAYSYSRRCHWPFDSAFVSVEGYVVPCCTIADPRIVNMGNIFEDSFNDIWTGEKYMNYRNRILENKLPAPCKNCYADTHKDLINIVV